jgi:hypothetical protein
MGDIRGCMMLNPATRQPGLLVIGHKAISDEHQAVAAINNVPATPRFLFRLSSARA